MKKFSPQLSWLDTLLKQSRIQTTPASMKRDEGRLLPLHKQIASPLFEVHSVSNNMAITGMYYTKCFRMNWTGKGDLVYEQATVRAR
ncbi:hypothetical protein J6590_076350 [Homalodisca vitripennis]|nr:hypothetical protein J6590_076350 [Homalodisca vitripennis]